MSDVLIVTSKVKNFIKAKSGLNTSGAVADELSNRVRELCERAVEKAQSEKRKTVMDRDIPSI